MMMDSKLRNSYNLKRLVTLTGIGLAIALSAMVASHALAKGDDIEAVSSEHVVNVFDRGEHRVFVTRANTVREALNLAEISISEGQDVVEPSLDEELVVSKYSVNIYRARPVTLVDGTRRQRVVTALQTPEQIAKVAGLELYDEDIVRESSIPDVLVDGADLVLTIDRATPVHLILYGQPMIVRTHL